MTRPIDWRSERGVAGVVLTIVIAWALGAVLLLTTTLVAAQSIDDRVASIARQTSAIDQDTDNVRLLDDTERLAAGILEAAEPLSGQLDQVEAAAKSIDGSVLDINDNVVGIQGSVDAILGNANGILASSRSIDQGVAAINRRADVVIGAARGIRSDTSAVLSQVRAILGHAASIDCHLVGIEEGFPFCAATGASEQPSQSSPEKGGRDVPRLVKGVTDAVESTVGKLVSRLF